MVLLMICNRPGISSADRWKFLKDFVEDFVAPCGNPFCHTFCHKKWSRKFCWNFVKDFVASTQIWRNFNTKFWTKFWQFFCGKMLWQNVVPQEKNSSKRERVRNFAFWQNVLLQHFAKRKLFKFCQTFRCFNSSSDEIRTKFSPKNLWQILWQNVLPQSTQQKVWEIWRNLSERNNEENPYTRTYCKWWEIMKSWLSSITIYIYIYIYLFIYLSIYLI